MQMKTGVEQAVYAILLLHLLPERAVLPGEAISEQLGTSPTYFQKILRKLVRADLISSVPGAKGGFKLKKKAGDIRVYDIYLAIEGKQSIYSSSGIFDDMFELEKENRCCLLTDLMEEAESVWKTVLKRETIASLLNELHTDRFQEEVELVQELIHEKAVL
ncbi:MAG TPA: Rrf2 family transcriptional regulator [Virgibacillus sp.]|nr:Rrf2 family transcriptional regulator [Virgibacillus sp.]